MYNLLLATLTVKVHFMTFRVERILTEITYYFKKTLKIRCNHCKYNDNKTIIIIITLACRLSLSNPHILFHIDMFLHKQFFCRRPRELQFLDSYNSYPREVY